LPPARVDRGPALEQRHPGERNSGPDEPPASRRPHQDRRHRSGVRAMNVIEVASLSHVGRVRASNQDWYGEFANGSGWRALVVADGMGGHQGGEVASRIAVDTIGKVLGTSHEEP